MTSVRTGIAEIRRELEKARGGIEGLVGLAERMRKRKVEMEQAGGIWQPPTRAELEEVARSAPHDSLRYRMALQALAINLETEKQ